MIALLPLLFLQAPPAPAAKLDEPTRQALEKALGWLASKQNTDGSWSDGGYAHNTAITSFAVLAYLSQGHLPGQGKFGEVVSRASRFLVASSRESDGCLVGARGGGGRDMYCHGMATLALAQLWGTTADQGIRPVLKRAVDLIVRCQNPAGGWRYAPSPSDADISVTVMQVMALRAARNAGLHVPDRTLDQAIEYINKCRDEKSGGYQYQPGSREPEFARTAAGVCVLHLTGKHDAAEVPKAIDYLKKKFDSKNHFYYGHYYASHAMHQVGGKEWDEWYARLKATLMPKQSADGSWSNRDLDGATAGPVYQTSIAVIALAVPAQFVPIYQR
ncbi:MAG: prenyltransferase/squalene oxidase repeat-containing protein [Planctomycetota bacterium]